MVKMTTRERLTPFIVALITTIVYMDTHSLHPFLSSYAGEMGAGLFLTGVIIASYSVLEDICEIPVGYVMDRVGRRKAFVQAGLIGDALAMVLYALSRNPLHLLVTRLIHGFTGSFAGPSIMALMGDIPHPLSKLGARMGIYGSSIILATIVGWCLGGVLVTYIGYEALFHALAILLFISFGLSFFIVEPEPFALPPERSKLRLKEVIGRVVSLFSSTEYSVSIAAIFAHMMSMGALVTLLSRHLGSLGFKPVHTGMLLAVFGITCLVLQVPAGFVSERIGRLNSLALGLIVEAASVFALPFAATLPPMLLCMVAYGSGYSFVFPSAAATILESSGRQERGLACAVFHVAFTEGIVLGAPLFALVASVGGYPMGLTSASIPLALVAIVLLLFRRR